VGGEGVDFLVPPKVEKGFDPIQAKHREDMQAVFGYLCDAMPGVGMCLFLFDEHAGEPRATYISNCRREQTLAAVKEWVARRRHAAPLGRGNRQV
jgi:hypothetical protein